MIPVFHLIDITLYSQNWPCHCLDMTLIGMFNVTKMFKWPHQSHYSGLEKQLKIYSGGLNYDVFFFSFWTSILLHIFGLGKCASLLAMCRQYVPQPKNYKE